MKHTSPISKTNIDDKDILLNRIANHQLMYGSFSTDPGIGYGRMGLVLFFFHFARHTDNPLYEDFAGEIVDEIFEDMHTELSWGFESGLCGIAWGIEYLLANNFLSGDSNDILFEIDQKIMEKDLRRITDYSFTTGLDGLACYVALRLAGQREPVSLDKTYINELVEACRKAQKNDDNPYIGTSLMHHLTDLNRKDYPYTDILRLIVGNQADSEIENLSWKNGLKLLLL